METPRFATSPKKSSLHSSESELREAEGTWSAHSAHWTSGGIRASRGNWTGFIRVPAWRPSIGDRIRTQ